MSDNNELLNQRREFLKRSLFSAASVGGLGCGASYMNLANAAVMPDANDFKTLVVVNLNGGNDSLNMLIPNTTAEYEQYRAPRPNLAFAKNELLPINPIGMPNGSFGLNPGMPEFQTMFENGDMAFVANVGGLVEPITKAEFLATNRVKQIPEGLGGHNTQTAYWQADHSNRINTSGDGWGGRLSDEFLINGVLPTNIAIQNGNNLFQRHQEQEFYNVGLSGLIRLRDFRGSTTSSAVLARRQALRQLNQLATNSSDPFQAHLGELFDRGINLNVSLQSALSNIEDLSDRFPAPLAGSGSAFASSMARAAEMILIREQLGMQRQIIFLEEAGFDTHSKQGENHYNLMADLSGMLGAFNQILKDEGVFNSVLTVTTSEFGRNLASNGDGTDHAWGAQHVVMGGPVDGKKIHGEFPSLELDGNDDYNGLGRMIPTISVTQYGATIANWLGVPANRLSTVFPNLGNFRGAEILDFLG